MIAEVKQAFAASGYLAMLRGAFAGVPYKIYAVAAGEEGRPVLPFLLASVLIRLPRFALTVLVTRAVAAALAPVLGVRGRAALLGIFWAVFYAIYWSSVS